MVLFYTANINKTLVTMLGNPLQLTHKTQKLCGPFLWMRFNCLPFTTKFPEIPGTHFIDLGRMKG